MSAALLRLGRWLLRRPRSLGITAVHASAIVESDYDGKSEFEGFTYEAREHFGYWEVIVRAGLPGSWPASARYEIDGTTGEIRSKYVHIL